MRKTYEVYLRNGTIIKVKADDFAVDYDNDGVTNWKAQNAAKWLFFHPKDLMAVVRVK